jgi:hypothetical protein
MIWSHAHSMSASRTAWLCAENRGREAEHERAQQALCPGKTTKRLIAQLERLGHTVTPQEATAA